MRWGRMDNRPQPEGRTFHVEGMAAALFSRLMFENREVTSKLTLRQSDLFWLANLPFMAYNRHALIAYRAITDLIGIALIPLDHRRLADRMKKWPEWEGIYADADFKNQLPR